MENSYAHLDEGDLQALWEQHRKNLGVLERQAATHGMNPPLPIINEIDSAKEKLTVLRDEFARRGLSPRSFDPAKNRGRQLYNAISLNDRQRELLVQLVDILSEASEPDAFVAMETNESSTAHIRFIGRPPRRLEGYMVDLRALARARLIALSTSGRTPTFDVCAEGEEYVAHLKCLRAESP